MSWLVETLAWTAALLALVLLLRRPVARQFGPQAAYALWALPFLRLLLPPIELPAWLAPAPAQESSASVEVMVIEAAHGAAPLHPAASLDWPALVPAVWLAGAVLFLGWRFNAYFRMRAELLSGARPVGEAGRVRLVETPQVASPLAFGVLDKVIALPIGFMALHDRHARDLALEHELAHHRGHDLAVNFAVQPLFALHWFNPLGWLGWRAMRRDQEAACDARVIAARGLAERAAYAALIAGHAAGPRLALAAPMACPVLGEKSIVHRLRSLKMTDISRRRRIAGRALVAAAVLALPLTASITYAEIPAAPEAPAAPLAPLPPGYAQAPEPPAPPLAPAAPETLEDADEQRVVVVRNKDGETTRQVLRKVRSEDGMAFYADGKPLSEEEFEARMAEFGDRMEGLDERLETLLKDIPEGDRRRVAVNRVRLGERLAVVPVVRMSCDGEGGTSESTTPDGKRVIRICERRIKGDALFGLRRAREQIARDTEMSETVRAEVLRSLDQEIARLGSSE